MDWTLTFGAFSSGFKSQDNRNFTPPEKTLPSTPHFDISRLSHALSFASKLCSAHL
jgi:hypothetical protein